MSVNLVSDETMEKLQAAGWTGPRPDAQDLVDQLPRVGVAILRQGDEESSGRLLWMAEIGDEARVAGDSGIGPTICEALAALWLKLQEEK
jgi:hypothetical protein